MHIHANGIRIEVEDSEALPGAVPGALRPDGQDKPVVLLIMGLGMQLIAWPDVFVDALVAAGFRVVRFDNRDAGLSEDMGRRGVRTPNPLWYALRSRLGLPARPPYTLQDMAEDALGVLDALGIARAHVVGASMGGMVAQRVAITAPHRTISLTSMISTSGAAGLPGPAPQVLKALLRPATAAERAGNEAALVVRGMRLFQLIGSPDHPFDDVQLRASVGAAVRRSVRAQGTLRQLMAVAADTRRADLLAQIRCPALVLHGDADTMLPLACGADTARRIPGARLVVLPGMGHLWPDEAYGAWTAHLLAFLAECDLAETAGVATSPAAAAFLQ
ncbi:MAG: Aclacinomycin methylesterase RdmC [Paracidovorax wautersii]|uniref:Aclacinomycin methylesterase RdmC n=1 Tax=Paracidovorax wautersii TaxID=1177982 RepID=A0A7V8FR21_9BURK|nr:MAG: Aclacinomycin methylesterase RdmC [Paracidovorax wautersii]